MRTGELGGMIVRDVMTRWPQTVPVFVRRRMSCPGCLMAPFMTVDEAAQEYGIEPEELACDLEEAIVVGDAAVRAPQGH